MMANQVTVDSIMSTLVIIMTVIIWFDMIFSAPWPSFYFFCTMLASIHSRKCLLLLPYCLQNHFLSSAVEACNAFITVQVAEPVVSPGPQQVSTTRSSWIPFLHKVGFSNRTISPIVVKNVRWISRQTTMCGPKRCSLLLLMWITCFDST